MIDFTPRVYYKLTLTLRSPLSVGSGRDDNTDHDCIVDSNGTPFIPATTIAGVLRSSLDEETAKKLFGYISTKQGEKEEAVPSRIIFYDGLLSEKSPKPFTTTRDFVKLENKVAVSGAKFDFEAVEPGAVFIAYAELLDENYCEIFENLLAELNAGILRFGAKVTRGYGQVSVYAQKKRIATFDDYADSSIFSFVPDETISLKKVQSDNMQITLTVKSMGGISIREYSTDVNMPDYVQLALHDKEKTPVIPGTSWAGAFRERFASFVGEDETKALFGYVEQKTGETQKSRILFSETALHGGTYKTLTRNAIDRFTNSTKDRALYTERTYYNGTGELTVTLPRNSAEECRNTLAACIADLHCGILAVGGSTAIGRGLFTVTKINGKAVADDNIYSAVKEILQNG